jgi:hypothetical protein
MKIPPCGALRCANGTLRLVYCFLEIYLARNSQHVLFSPD